MPVRWRGWWSGTRTISIKDYGSARSSWQRSQPLEPLLGDYLDYLQAAAYQGENNPAEVLKTLDGFDQKYPDSLQSHDVALLYAERFDGDQRTADKPPRYLEKHRQPVKSDIELTLGRAYLAAGDKSKSGGDLPQNLF